MGGGMSKEGRSRRTKIPNISAPQDPIMHVPRPRLDHDGKAIRIEDYELDRKTLRKALTSMADFIHSQGQNITIIAVGGAVNVLLLQDRLSTHDVDFFGTNLNNNQRILLDEAARFAEWKSRVPLGGEWFNNQTMLWLPPNVHRRVTQEALQQNEVVFEKRGLKVVAAPWSYAFCGKLNRLVRRSEVRQYDVADAASYLRHYILKHGGPVSAAQIKHWCQVYQKDMSNEAVHRVKKEYRHVYGSCGITG